MYTQKKTKTTTIEIKTQAAHMAKTEMELLLELQPQDGGVFSRANSTFTVDIQTVEWRASS